MLSYPADVPTLETERTIMRALRKSDVEGLARMYADEEMMQFIGHGKTRSYDETFRTVAMLIGHWTLRGYGMWAVCDKRTETLVGRVGLHFPEGWPEPECGWLIDRDRWGEGLGPETACAAIKFAFERLGWKRCIALIAKGNVGSERVAEKVGMAFERDHDLLGTSVSLYAVSGDRFNELFTTALGR